MTETYNVRAYHLDQMEATPLVVEADNAIDAMRQHPRFQYGGQTTHRLGGPEFQAHVQFDPLLGHSGIEAIHTSLTPEKVKELEAVRLHVDRRKLAFDLIRAKP